MTPLEIAVQLAPLIGSDGVTTYASSFNGINLSDGDKAAIAIAETQALQEIFALGPTALSEQLYGDVLRPPANVTFNATQYSETISGFATWANWMQGCTFQGGDGEDNELISATQLVRPYMGSSGAVSGTVYADAIRLPDWVKNTMDPVWTPRVPQLRAATSREEFRFYNSPYIGDRAHHHSHGAYYTSRNKTVGEPCVYFVEGRYDPSTGALPLFMRFNPMPGSAYPITFRVKRKSPVITASDLAATGALVTGALTPDATGFYPFQALDQNGRNTYIRQGADPYALIYSNVAWRIIRLVFSLSGQNWAGSADPAIIAGDYTPGAGATGTATVALSGTNLVIPTDWHESILLPFAKRWFIGHPSFQNPSAAAQIMAQYQVAKQTLESFIPQITPARGHYQ